MRERNVHIQLTADSLRVISSFQVLGKNVNAVMDFEPIPLENGNIVLQERRFSLGRLSLPGERVLSLLHSQAELPEVVKIIPEKNQILIQLNKLERLDPYYIRVATFSLEKDAFSFQVGKYSRQK